MASIFICRCGERIKTNLYGGNNVDFRVSEEVTEILEGMKGDEFGAALLKCPKIYECKMCRRLWFNYPGGVLKVYEFEDEIT